MTEQPRPLAATAAPADAQSDATATVSRRS